MEQRELRRRLLTARAWGEFDSREDLAEAIDEDGLGAAVLGQIERGERMARPRDLKAIADACSVPHALLLDDAFAPFRTLDPEAGSGAYLLAAVHALEELLDRGDPKSAALAELRQLRQTSRPASGRSESNRD